MRSLEQLDRWIAGRMKNWTSRVAGAPRGRELLEIRRDILEDVRDRIEPKGQGKSIFAYNTLGIRIAAETADDHSRYEAAFSGEHGIEDDIRELLVEAGCQVPSGFTASVTVIEDTGSIAPFEIEYAKRKGGVTGTQRPAESARPTAKLTIIRGQADVTEYAIAANRVNIGRLKEVVGEKDGLRRRNDVAFADSEATVSREHAYIRWDAQNAKFRLYDSYSQRGTSVFRDGRRLEVSKGASRGLQLQSGDEIHLGHARLKFESDSKAIS